MGLEGNIFAIKETSYLYICTFQRTNSRLCTPRTIHITIYVNFTTVDIITRFTSLSCSRTIFCVSRNCQFDCSMVWGRGSSTVYNIYENLRLSLLLIKTFYTHNITATNKTNTNNIQSQLISYFNLKLKNLLFRMSSKRSYSQTIVQM